MTAAGSGPDDADMWLMNDDGTDPHPFLESPANERDPSVSPSGGWIAYVSNETGGDEVWVQPFADGGDFPVWASDDGIVFLSRDVAVVA